MPSFAHHRAHAAKLCRACASTMQSQPGSAMSQSSQTWESFLTTLWSQVGWEAAEDKHTTRPNLGSMEKNEVSMLLKMSYITRVSPAIQDILTHSPDGKELTVLLICVEG